MGIFDKGKEKKEKPDFTNVAGGASSTAPRAAETKTGGASYTVRSGDTLWAISERYYGDGNKWRKIYEANRDQIEDPDLIHPGQQLRIPAEGGGD